MSDSLAVLVAKTGTVGCAVLPLTTPMLIGDWGGWFLANVVIGAFAPAVFISILRAAQTAGRTNANVAYFDAYRGGQLGYIALGWLAGSAAEMCTAISQQQEPASIFQLVLILGLAIATIFATIYTGIRTAPVISTAAPPSATTAAEIALQRLQAIPATDWVTQTSEIAGLSEATAKEIILAALKQRADEKAAQEANAADALQKDGDLFKKLRWITVLTFALVGGVHYVLS